jgi:hypothetical protein
MVIGLSFSEFKSLDENLDFWFEVRTLHLEHITYEKIASSFMSCYKLIDHISGMF